MESRGEIILTGGTKELGDTPVPVPLCLPQVPNTGKGLISVYVKYLQMSSIYI
jgi:hypothetical protein